MRIYFITILLLVFFASCGDKDKHPIPNTPVYIDPIYIYDPEYIDLINPYGQVKIDCVGYLGNGIIIVNVGIGTNKYMAYDATCTYELKKGCSVEPDSNSISLLKCPCCGTTYDITFGDVSSGKALYPLKTYKVVLDNDRIWVY